MPAGKPRLPTEQAAFSVGRQHDHHRIGPREVMRAARGTFAPPAAGRRHGRRAAIGAETVFGVPEQQRLAFRQRAEIVGRDAAVHRNLAQVEQGELGDASREGRRRRRRSAWRRRDRACLRRERPVRSDGRGSLPPPSRTRDRSHRSHPRPQAASAPPHRRSRRACAPKAGRPGRPDKARRRGDLPAGQACCARNRETWWTSKTPSGSCHSQDSEAVRAATVLAPRW